MQAIPTVILGIHIGHDRSAALIVNGKVEAAIAEERLDRIKHSPGDVLPHQSIESVLSIGNIKKEHLSAIAISFSGILISEEIKHTWKREIRAYFNISADSIFFVGHHLAHAYAVYYTSPFDDAAIMIADGAGDMLSENNCEAESYYFAHNGIITPFFSRYQSMPSKLGSPLCEYRKDYMMDSECNLPIGIGRKYEQITKLLGFSFGQAGKTMGLSSYGDSLISFTPQQLGMNHSLTRGDYLSQLHDEQLKANSYSEFVKEHKANIAKDIQRVTEAMLLSCIEEFSSYSPTKNLCLSGGVFLNCVANKKIIDRQYFDRVFLTPASGDDGQAIGAAFFVYRNKFNGTKASHFNTPYLGLEYSLEKCQDALANLNEQTHFSQTTILDDNARATHLAQVLSNDLVYGILQGRSEVGPRALGNRSILASPLNSGMRDYINQHIKYRELFRPFAPMVTEEDASKFFDLSCESPYMLITCDVKKEFRQLLPAITHVDGSTRLQTVRKDDNPFIHTLLKAFEKETGFPILLNTSFNTTNEPIVESPQDAINAMINSQLDGIVLEKIVVERL